MCMGCGLVQLLHSYEQSELYGEHYGYRSALNSSMVRHLRAKALDLDSMASPTKGDVVLDIGSNDGTLLGCYPVRGQKLIGFDPCASRFRQYYRRDIAAEAKFFSASEYRNTVGHAKAKIVTSIAMFYDLDQPLEFMREVGEVLAEDGIWHLEQSYLPAMLEATAYDTICHEHLEYYALRQIKWMVDQVGLKIVSVARNDVNGGSFALTLAKEGAPYSEDVKNAGAMLAEEERLALGTLAPYREFRERVLQHREELLTVLSDMQRQGRTVLGYGASTKGNVLLQFCDISAKDLTAIAEVNEDKFGCYTPGTNIPIISEVDAKRMRPDCFLVLPWHFRANIIHREEGYLRDGGAILFPLPRVELVTA